MHSEEANALLVFFTLLMVQTPKEPFNVNRGERDRRRLRLKSLLPLLIRAHAQFAVFTLLIGDDLLKDILVNILVKQASALRCISNILRMTRLNSTFQSLLDMC